MNLKKHQQYTGKPNDLILSNSKIIVQSGIETLFRMPLIPGINDDIQNIKDTAAFLNGLGNNYRRIELMPYHRLGKGKYESLNKPFHLPDILSPEPEQVEAVKKVFEDNGIKCSVSR
jgi:pyruvate formate lyase activating enzyme